MFPLNKDGIDGVKLPRLFYMKMFLQTIWILIINVVLCILFAFLFDNADNTPFPSLRGLF